MRIVDDGQPPVAALPSGKPALASGAQGGGHGVLGMTERAAAFGGTLIAGPAEKRRLAGGGDAAHLQGTNPRMTIRVVLADDQALLRKGFRMILEAEDDISIIGEAADGEAALRLVELYEPDVVLMDVRMPTLDGIGATLAITASGSMSHVLILTTFDLDEYAFGALRAGASGFLLKDVPPHELAQAIRTVARGDAVVSPRITKRLLEEYADQLPDLSGDRRGDAAVPAVLSGLTVENVKCSWPWPKGSRTWKSVSASSSRRRP